MSYSPDQPPRSSWPVETGSGAPHELRAKLLPPVIAAVAGIVAAVPLVLIATAAFTQDSRPAVSTPSNPDQSLLGQVPYGSH
ncbi:hypothetical protein Srot_2163 [Segniliparus rotundus DSM 44985]|uniref:Uncharacterized protein n=1 Tax=Segniliparus rotundus (strain ATCC BAA-972 / CDC 1076 / CIP 108378 / DSM 44985 / JCM 13578) TaxID=640132 RepID=D6Z9U5_SEGRD|nr:DUF2613 domain-containing protein [Segniliparus rotundus]ADG98615.1 hypothetical protein Srot_2163 [Segniliparus rotundus DSM 44985]